MADSKFGIIMIGKIDGINVIVAPFTEGRFSVGERAFLIPKGDPKSTERKVNANAEFFEETGIDINLLEYQPSHPLRQGRDKKDIFHGAKIIQRLEMPPQRYPANSGKQTELNLDVVIVDNIASLTPHLKSQHQGVLVPAGEQAIEKGLPSFADLIKIMHRHGLPESITSEADFDMHIENSDAIKSLQKGFDAIRKDLEAKGLVGDICGVKCDNKINPLRYFQEGAVIIPVPEYECEVRSFGKCSSDRKTIAYKSSLTGNGSLPGQLDAVLYAVSQVQDIMDHVKLESGGKGR